MTELPHLQFLIHEMELTPTFLEILPVLLEGGVGKGVQCCNLFPHNPSPQQPEALYSSSPLLKPLQAPRCIPREHKLLTTASKATSLIHYLQPRNPPHSSLTRPSSSSRPLHLPKRSSTRPPCYSGLRARSTSSPLAEGTWADFPFHPSQCKISTGTCLPSTGHQGQACLPSAKERAAN